MQSAPSASRGLTHRYGQRRALAVSSLTIERGEIVRLSRAQRRRQDDAVSPALDADSVQPGESTSSASIVARQPQAVRERHRRRVSGPQPRQEAHGRARTSITRGHLYGLSGARACSARRTRCSTRLGLTDRAGDRVETLSGGLRRRVELAKGMLHRPRLLLLDEPSTGLDPGARSDLWNYLQQIRDDDGVTIVLTTHLLEEADKADRIGDPERRAAGGARHARRACGRPSAAIRSRSQTADPPTLAAGDSRAVRLRGQRARRPRAAGAARRARVDRAAGRGVSRPDRIDHARQADAGRRVHRPHRASVLAGRTSEIGER